VPSNAKSAKKSEKKTAASRVLYLYAISQMPKTAAPVIAAEGIDGTAPLEAIRCGSYICWASRVAKKEFADTLSDRMQDLEWLATTGLRHQRAVAEIAANSTSLPARFGTVFLTEAFERVADADEWGIKIFAEPKRVSRPTTKAASGSDYLKRKAELLQPRKGQLDKEVQNFVSAMTQLAVAASPGGKASAGQPGLAWHGSFLIRRADRKKLDAALKKYAAAWKDRRRIDCSGPWPPYSFVGEHVH
jgi:hypothetical protein